MYKTPSVLIFFSVGVAEKGIFPKPKSGCRRAEAVFFGRLRNIEKSRVLVASDILGPEKPVMFLNPINCFTLFNWLGHKIQHMDRCLKFNDEIPKIELALRMK